MHWADDVLTGSTAGQMEQMVRIFGDMGLVEVREGVPDDPDFPDTMMVASFGPGVKPPEMPKAAEPKLGIAPSTPKLDSQAALHQQILKGSGRPPDTEFPLPVRYPGASD